MLNWKAIEMIQIDFLKWIRGMRWFGYTYITFHVPGEKPHGNWHRNNSIFIKSMYEWAEELKNDQD